MDALLKVASDAVDIARDIILDREPGRVTVKGDRDMASEVDYEIEDRLSSFLRERTPTIGFLGEEGGRGGGSHELTWTLDPIDGTVNFIHGSPLCCVSLALLRGNTPILGVVDLPFFSMRYTATAGGGAYNNKRRLAVAQASTLSEAVIAVGEYAVGPGAPEHNRVQLAITERLASQAQRIRMHGSAAIDLVWLAEGRTDGIVIMSNSPWDTSAGVIIAREAGAIIVDRDGSPHTPESSATIGTNPTLLPQLLGIVVNV